MSIERDKTDKLMNDDKLVHFLADGVLSQLNVEGRTLAAKLILESIDFYKRTYGKTEGQ